jgi:hypothetical protein
MEDKNFLEKPFIIIQSYFTLYACFCLVLDAVESANRRDEMQLKAPKCVRNGNSEMCVYVSDWAPNGNAPFHAFHSSSDFACAAETKSRGNMDAVGLHCYQQKNKGISCCLLFVQVFAMVPFLICRVPTANSR